MTSGQVKLHTMAYLLYQGGSQAVATEYRSMDVFAVNRSGFGIEIEVKVSWSDFMSEIETMKYLLDPEQDHGFSAIKKNNGEWKYLKKFDKHRSYLISEATHSPRPRYFYFAVPHEFVDKALKQLEGSPYGLMEDLGNFVRVKKKARILSDCKFDDYFYFLRKVSNENYQLRKRVIEVNTNK